jgi:redox-sensitive bicupin YhaK (pirin superfamily)
VAQRLIGTIVLGEADRAVLDESDFRVSGLVAHEWIGPSVAVHGVGPLVTVHDARFEPGRGITHHPHRYHERLFYILEGAVEHDDSLNGIRGHMGTGDLGRLTEGMRGIYHQEWNRTDGPARAFVLVVTTDPIPPRASFVALRDGDAPRYGEGDGVRTKELVGPRANFPLHGDVRLLTDTTIAGGAHLRRALAEGEGAVTFPLEGEIALEGSRLTPPSMAVLPPALDPRSIELSATTPVRLLWVTFGLGNRLLRRVID